MQQLAPADTVLQVRDLSKRFGEREALRGVSFQADRGELVAVIGPNGAGKTTLLSIVAGAQRADHGDVTAPAALGWVPQQHAVYTKLTVAENLRLFARLEKRPDVERVVGRMLELTALQDRAGDPVGELSGGNRQRVNIAIGLLGSPQLLLLDEPSAALDPRQRSRLWDLIVRLAADEGTTVLYATHNIVEAERYASRVVVLADGELLFSGSPQELENEVAAGEHRRARDFEEAFVLFLRERGH